MEQMKFASGEMIFAEGSFATTMYEIVEGSVGIFADYGLPSERELAVLGAGEVFGEMGLVEFYPRSATAVALADDTLVNEVTYNEFVDFMKSKPDKVLGVMRQVSARLRETERRYLEARETVTSAVEAEQRGLRRDGGLRGRLGRMVEAFRRSVRKG